MRRPTLLAAFGAILLGFGPAHAQSDALLGDRAFATGDYGVALQEWSALAEAGDASAMLGVGTLYDTGHGVRQDFGAALQWYRRAAEAGSTRAAFNVGVMYDSGRGTAVDRAEAVRWYRRAADAGNGRAAYNLGVIFRDGDGVQRDRAAAIRYFGIADRNRIPSARDSLAALGVAVHPARPAPEAPQTRSDQEAEALVDFSTAALGRASTLGPAARRATRFMGVFQEEAAHGNYLAQYDLGFAHQFGFGVKRDLVRAYVYYLRAQKSEMLEVRAAAGAGAVELGRLLTPDQHVEARNQLLDAAR